MKMMSMIVAASLVFGLMPAPAALATVKGPVKRKVDPEEAKRKEQEAKAAAEKAVADKLAAEKAAAEKAEADKKAAEEAKLAAEKEAAEKKKEDEAAAAAAAAKAAEPPKGTPTWYFMLAPDSAPENAKIIQGALIKAVGANDKLHLVDGDLSALPADLQAALNDGCRVNSCRTAILAALTGRSLTAKVPQGLIVEMNSSGSTLILTLFGADGRTLGRSDANCVGCLEDEPKRDLVLGELLQDLFIKPKDKAVVSRAQGGQGPLVRGRRSRKAPKARRKGVKVWAPSVWAYGGAGFLAASGTTLMIMSSQAHGAYVQAINEERGPGEIQGIADAGKQRQALAYTSLVLSAGVVVASYVLEQEMRR